MKEEWKNVVGYEGLYEVSNLGRVKSLSRKVYRKAFGSYTRPETILNPPIYHCRPKKKPEDGYRIANLYKDGISKRKGVHVLVAQAFIPNPQHKAMVNHKDGVKLNNAVENLEWVTSHENHLHAAAHGLKARGSRNTNSRLTEEDVKTIKHLLSLGIPQRQIAKQFGVGQAAIKDINLGNTWKYVDMKTKTFNINKDQYEALKEMSSKKAEFHAAIRTYGPASREAVIARERSSIAISKALQKLVHLEPEYSNLLNAI